MLERVLTRSDAHRLWRVEDGVHLVATDGAAGVEDAEDAVEDAEVVRLLLGAGGSDFLRSSCLRLSAASSSGVLGLIGDGARDDRLDGSLVWWCRELAKLLMPELTFLATWVSDSDKSA